MNDELYYIWLSSVCGAGSIAPAALLRRYGGARDIYPLERSRILEDGLKLNADVLDRLEDKNLDAAKRSLEWCAQNGVYVVTCDSPLYPSRLRAIYNFPAVLYVKGDLEPLDKTACIAVVGTRDMSEYGEAAAYCLARGLSMAGAAVVSGMAEGIDTCAHRGALDRGGYTVAVLGNGIDRAYPAKNEDLMKHIAMLGAVITEYAPFTPPSGPHFPVRNRIISGLCHGTVVVEAGERSGAMITANCAREQGRDIYAVPGCFDSPGSYGPNQLIKRNARLATCAADVLSGYDFLFRGRIVLDGIDDINADMAKYRRYLASRAGNKPVQTPAKPIPEKAQAAVPKPAPSKPLRVAAKTYPTELSADEKAMYEQICRSGGCIPEELAGEFPIAQVMSCLTVLELKGLVEPHPGGVYKSSEK